jgi:outer membrane receptor protein involved in Fe transport
VLDAHQIADLYVGVELDAISDGLKGMKLQLNVNNLFDESYLGGVSGGWGAWIGAPRTATATLTVDF